MPSLTISLPDFIHALKSAHMQNASYTYGPALNGYWYYLTITLDGEEHKYRTPGFNLMKEEDVAAFMAELSECRRSLMT